MLFLLIERTKGAERNIHAAAHALSAVSPYLKPVAAKQVLRRVALGPTLVTDVVQDADRDALLAEFSRCGFTATFTENAHVALSAGKPNSAKPLDAIDRVLAASCS